MLAIREILCSRKILFWPIPKSLCSRSAKLSEFLNSRKLFAKVSTPKVNTYSDSSYNLKFRSFLNYFLLSPNLTDHSYFNVNLRLKGLKLTVKQNP